MRIQRSFRKLDFSRQWRQGPWHSPRQPCVGSKEDLEGKGSGEGLQGHRMAARHCSPLPQLPGGALKVLGSSLDTITTADHIKGKWSRFGCCCTRPVRSPHCVFWPSESQVTFTGVCHQPVTGNHHNHPNGTSYQSIWWDEPDKEPRR